MLNIILTLTASFLITFLAIPVIIQVAKDKKLYDEPGERKIHKVVIPTLGGLGIFAGFIISYLVGVPANLTAGFENLHLAARFYEVISRCQAAYPCSNDSDLLHGSFLIFWIPSRLQVMPSRSM